MIEIDPELKYCPRCNDEYRAEIVQCAACGIPLLSGAEVLKRQGDVRSRRENRRRAIGPEDDIVALHKGDMQEIKRIEAELRREKIATLLVGEGGGSCGKGCCGTSLYLHVHRDDAADAVAVIQSYIDRTTAISHHDLSHCDEVFNPEKVQACCPACGFRFQTSSTVCPDCGLCFG